MINLFILKRGQSSWGKQSRNYSSETQVTWFQKLSLKSNLLCKFFVQVLRISVDKVIKQLKYIQKVQQKTKDKDESV